MKSIIILLAVILPAVGFAKNYQCHVENVIVKYKTSEESLTAEFLLDKKVVTTCMFKTTSSPSPRNGVANSITQNYEKVSCSDESVKLGTGMGISSEAYTKTNHKYDTAFFFVFKGRDPIDCVAVK